MNCGGALDDLRYRFEPESDDDVAALRRVTALLQRMEAASLPDERAVEAQEAVDRG